MTREERMCPMWAGRTCKEEEDRGMREGGTFSQLTVEDS